MAASIESVAAAYGFSMRQQRLIAALIDSGSLRLAAAEHRLPYASARNTLAEVKAKTGIATVPQLIGHFLDLLHAGGSSRRHDLFDLSERQYAIAASLSVAKSRADIARQLGVSDAVIDGEIKTIYLILGVRSAGEVARVFAAAMRDEPDIGSEHELPERTVTLGERRVALSDFGPSNGRPVFILHSTITARTPPSRLVAALHAAGYRPLALDRPGFGGTDMARDGDPFAAAAIDLAGVCATLGLDRVALVARGSGQAAVRTTALFPHLIDHAVLVNPTPAVAFTTVDRGPLGAVKRHFARRPFAIEAMIRALGGFATPRRMESGMLRAFASSAPDFALVRDDPQFLADYLRAVRGFAAGRVMGYVAEQVAWARGYDPAPLPGLTRWRVVQGRQFILHEPAQAIGYWRRTLPDTPVTWVEAAGQMLAYSHPEAVVTALQDAGR